MTPSPTHMQYPTPFTSLSGINAAAVEIAICTRIAFYYVSLWTSMSFKSNTLLDSQNIIIGIPQIWKTRRITG